jgi:hypothetical protein
MEPDEFRNQAGEYEAWLIEHPYGFVLNCHRNNPPSDTPVLHHARCETIREPFTEEYVKVCADDEDDLYLWSLKNAGKQPSKNCRCWS